MTQVGEKSKNSDGSTENDKGQNQTSAKAATKPPLNDNVIKAVGKRYVTERQLAEPVADHVALRWGDITKQGLPEEDKKLIIDKYPPAKNCIFSDPPKLNDDVKEVLSKNVKSRDEKIVERQRKISAGLGAAGLLINQFMNVENVDLKLIEKISDIGSIFSDLQHDENMIRKNLISSNINESFKNTLKEANPEEFLFGNDLEEKLKARELLEKSSKKLKSYKHPDSKNLRRPFYRPKHTKTTQLNGYRPHPASSRKDHWKDWKDQRSHYQPKERNYRQPKQQQQPNRRF